MSTASEKKVKDFLSASQRRRLSDLETRLGYATTLSDVRNIRFQLQELKDIAKENYRNERKLEIYNEQMANKDHQQTQEVSINGETYTVKLKEYDLSPKSTGKWVARKAKAPDQGKSPSVYPKTSASSKQTQ